MLDDAAGLAEALAECGAIVHLAGLAHRDGSGAPQEAEFRRVNADLPLTLAQAAIAAGVRRMVFISTIFVAGSGGKEPLSPHAPPRPEGAYARSKAAAEAALLGLSGIEIVVVRPPLVYGPGAGGNLARLERLAVLPVPLPFGSIRNRRDMIGRANLADALVFLAHSTEGAGAIFHIRDGDPISLAELLGWMRARKGRAAGLWPVPAGAVRTLLGMALGPHRRDQLTGDFAVDDASLRALGWRPPYRAGFDYWGQNAQERPAKRLKA
jgi:UDP-glucose 4-epimerase